MRPSLAFLLLLLIVWPGLNLLHAQDASCHFSIGDIHYEGTAPYKAADIFTTSSSNTTGEVSWMHWEDDCLLVKSTTGIWGYPEGNLAVKPQRLVEADADDWLSRVIERHPDGSWGMMESIFAYSHDGQRLVRRSDTGMGRNFLEVVDYASRGVIDSVQLNFNFYFTALAFSPDDHDIIALGSSGKIYRWSADNLSVPPLAMRFDRPYGTEKWFNVDRSEIEIAPLIVGDLLYINQSDGTVTVLNWRTGELVHILKGPRGAISQMVYQAHKDRLVATSTDGAVHLWDASTGEYLGALQSLTGRASPLLTLALNSQETHVVTSDAMGVLRLWPLEVPASPQIAVPSVPLNDIAYASNGAWLALAGDDGLLQIIKPDGTLKREFQGHSGAVNAVSINETGEWLVSAGDDTTIRRWHINTWTPPNHVEPDILEVHQWPVQDTAVAPNNEWFSAGWDRLVIQYQIYSYGISSPRLKGHTTYVESVAASRDGQRVASGDWAGIIAVWTLEEDDSSYPSSRFIPHFVSSESGRVNALAFNPESTILAAGHENGVITLWDVTTQPFTLVTTLTLSGPVNDLAFTSDGHALLSVGEALHLWETTTWSEMGVLRLHTGPINALAIHPDGHSVMTVGEDGLVIETSLSETAETESAPHFAPHDNPYS